MDIVITGLICSVCTAVGFFLGLPFGAWYVTRHDGEDS